jgi:hypothetical protein
VESYDTDALGIDSLDALRIAARDDEGLQLLVRGLDFRRHPVLTSRGVDLGKIANVVVDEGGNVIEYRVRKGSFGWLQTGEEGYSA